MKFTQPEILFSNVMQASREADKALNGGDSLFDFTNVKRVDSSAIAMILDLIRRGRGKGLEVRVQNPPESFKRLEKLYGLTKIIPNH